VCFTVTITGIIASYSVALGANELGFEESIDFSSHMDHVASFVRVVTFIPHIFFNSKSDFLNAVNQGIFFQINSNLELD
jgi:hypothetical protein